MTLFAKGAFVEDPWADREVLSIADWRERGMETLPHPLAVQLDPGFAVEKIAEHLDTFALIKIVFPKFTDGRGYSMGWLLRSRFSYHGEMRATGDVLFDEIQFMIRCGFDAFDIVDPETVRLLQDGRRAAAFAHFYQPGLEAEVPAGTRPWARRATGERPGNLG